MFENSLRKLLFVGVVTTGGENGSLGGEDKIG